MLKKRNFTPSASARLAYQRWLAQQLKRLSQLAQFVQSLGETWHRTRQVITKATAVVLLAGGVFTMWLAPTALAAPPAAVNAIVAVNTTNDEFNTGGACSLREAIELANGDTTERGCGTTAATVINLGSGTYTLSQSGTENDGTLETPASSANGQINDLDIDTGTTVTINGNGSANTIIQAGTISDDGTGGVGNGIDRVFHVLGNVTLNDVTIRNGLAAGAVGNGRGVGGGIRIDQGGVVQLNSSIVTGNTTRSTDGDLDYNGLGGGIYNNRGTLTLNNTDVTNNISTSLGGGVMTEIFPSGTAITTITGGSISNNQSGEGGGGFFQNYASGTSTLVISGTTIASNTAERAGGGVVVDPEQGMIDATFNNVTIDGNQIPAANAIRGAGIDTQDSNNGDSIVRILNSRITNNVIQGSNTNRDGGGAVFQAHNTIIHNSIISGNVAPGNGAGIAASSNPITITDSLIHNNTAGNYAGGVYLANNSQPFIANTTVSGNSANNGSYGVAGIYASNATGTIINATITGNTGAGDGNGLYVGNNGTIDLINSIVTANSGNECATYNGGTINGTNNIYESGNCGSQVAATITGFSSTLADNGGDSDTHALALTSNAVDAGDQTACDTNGITQDQRNTINRITCDIGAFEAGDLICGIQGDVEPTEYSFPNGMRIDVNDDGTNLDCISIIEVPQNHPNAGGVSNLETGRYWSISGLQSDVSTTANTDFLVDVTLPHSIAIPNENTRVCRYSGAAWDCRNDGHTGTTVTGNGFNAFSDWTVGNNVGPTAVTNLQTQTTPPATTSLLPLLLTTLLATLTSAYLWVRRPRRSTF